MENMNYLDAAIGAIVIISALIGLARGLIKEMLSLVAWGASIYVAWRFAEQIAHDYIHHFIDDDLVSYIAAFGLLFLGTLFVIGLFNLIITQILNSAGLGGVDRFLGMIFGLVRGLVMATLAVFIISLTPLTDDGWWQHSELRPGFSKVGEWAWQQIPAHVRKLLNSEEQSTHSVQPESVKADKSVQLSQQTTYHQAFVDEHPSRHDSIRLQSLQQPARIIADSDSSQIKTASEVVRHVDTENSRVKEIRRDSVFVEKESAPSRRENVKSTEVAIPTTHDSVVEKVTKPNRHVVSEMDDSLRDMASRAVITQQETAVHTKHQAITKRDVFSDIGKVDDAIHLESIDKSADVVSAEQIQDKNQSQSSTHKAVSSEHKDVFRKLASSPKLLFQFDSEQ